MDSYLTTLLSLACGYGLYSLYKARSQPSLQYLGPPPPSFVFGHSLDVAQAPVGTRYPVWEKEYGPTYPLRGPFGKSVMVVGDPKGSNYVMHQKNFQRNPGDRTLINLCFGYSLFSAEGDEHRTMRKSLSGPFTNQSTQEVSHVFFDLAERLIQSWEKSLEASSNDVVDITGDIHRLTLDGISMTMFAQDLSTMHSDIPAVIANITHSPPDGMVDITLKTLAGRFPILMKLPSPMKRWCNHLRTSLGAIAKEVWSGHQADGMHAKLLTALGSQNFSEDITVAHIIGVLFAGSETTANVIIDCFYELSTHPEIQKKLRAELSAFESTTGRQAGYEDLMSPTTLPYLDAVIREAIRTRAVLASVSRVAAEDDVIPLQFPIKRKSDLSEVYEIPVKAGTLIEVPIRDGLNISETIWGPDAKTFNPERWLKPEGLPETVKWVSAQGHVLTFGDGLKVCMGRLFALAEFKVVVSSVIRRFVLEQVKGNEFDFYHVGGNTIQPMIRGRESEGPQMPLKLSHVHI
ncbi:hypothetical protein PQX77_011384 [Marasmius sp. AFHP31]|nr:hypothetical protein PQX77_011384 [Marasmius sp. AFHP31]